MNTGVLIFNFIHYFMNDLSSLLEITCGYWENSENLKLVYIWVFKQDKTLRKEEEVREWVERNTHIKKEAFLPSSSLEVV